MPLIHVALVAATVLGTVAVRWWLRREREMQQRLGRTADALRLLDAVLESAGTLVFVTDHEGRVIRWNRTAEAVTGYTFDDVHGSRLWHLVVPQHEQELVAEHIATFDAAHFPRHAEHDWVTRSGETRRIEWTSTCLTDDDGRLSHVIASGVDVTERREVERRYRTVVELTDEGLWMIDAASVTTLVNPRMAEMLGRPAEDVVGRHLLDLVDPTEAGEAAIHLERCRQGLSEVHDLTFTRPDGSVVHAEVSRSPVIGSDGVYQGAVALVRDVTAHRALEAEQRLLQRRYERVRDGLPGVVFETDGEGHVVFVSKEWESLIGPPSDDALGFGWVRAIHDEDRARIIEGAFRTLRTGEPFEAMHRMVTLDGDVRWVLNRAAAVRDDRGEVAAVVGMLIDETELVEANALATEFASVIEASTDFVVIFDLDRRVTRLSSNTTMVLGLRVGDDVGAMFDDQDADRFEREALPRVLADGAWQGELTLRCEAYDLPVSASFVAHAGHDGHYRQISVVARDISELRSAQARLAALADHDHLTGLPNRRAITRRLGEHLGAGAEVAVLFVDLDGFKSVNDTYGHEVGDEVLVAAATRLRDATRGSDTVARLGGDEFVVLLHDQSALAVDLVVDRLVDQMQAPLHTSVGPVRVSASIGVHRARPTDTPATALNAADAAMYEAKRAGKATARVSAG